MPFNVISAASGLWKWVYAQIISLRLGISVVGALEDGHSGGGE
jgi:hypothetical protein